MLYSFKVACCHIALQLVYIHTYSFCCCNTLQLETLFAAVLLFYQLNMHTVVAAVAPYGFRFANKDTCNNCSCNASQLQTCICLKHICSYTYVQHLQLLAAVLLYSFYQLNIHTMIVAVVSYGFMTELVTLVACSHFPDMIGIYTCSIQIGALLLIVLHLGNSAISGAVQSQH